MQGENEKKSEKISRLSENLKLLISRKGHTQESYGSMYGIKKARFNHYLTGKTAMPVGLFLEIAKAEKVDPFTLYFGEISNTETAEGVIYDSGTTPAYEKKEQKLIDTVHQMSMMINEVPALRERVEKLEAKVRKLEGKGK